MAGTKRPRPLDASAGAFILAAPMRRHDIMTLPSDQRGSD